MPVVSLAARCLTSKRDGKIQEKKKQLKKSNVKQTGLSWKASALQTSGAGKAFWESITACSPIIICFPKCREDAHAGPDVCLD